jgi:hypothetical protein
MTSMTPAQLAKKWASNLGSATTNITAGVQGVTVAPGQAAARQKDVWLQKIQESQDKWASAVAAVPLADWQNAMVQKGIPRIASGATAATGKFESFMGKLLPYEQNAIQSLEKRGTLENNINRMVAFTRRMAQFKNK